MIVIGHYIAEIALILLIFAGLGWFIGSSTAVFFIGTLGGTMMLLMGFRITRSSNSLSELKENNGITKDYGPILSGFLQVFQTPSFSYGGPPLDGHLFLKDWNLQEYLVF